MEALERYMYGQGEGEEMYRVLFRIVVAGILAFVSIWIGSIPFTNSVIIRTYDKELGRLVNRPNQKVEFRTEGSAESQVGLHGLTGVSSFSQSEPKVVIWGDSHVEAWQVRDSDKIAGQMNSQLKNSSHPLKAIGIGEAGVSWAQHYFDIPRYEKILGNVKAHYIVLGGIGRALPTNDAQAKNQYAQFVATQNGYQLLDRLESPADNKKVLPLLQRLELRFLYTFISKIRSGKIWKLSFTLGPHKHQKPAQNTSGKESPSAYENEDALVWLMEKLKSQTSVPLCVVFAPDTPRIYNDKIFYRSHDKDKEVEALKRACAKCGVRFMDVSVAFEAFYKKTGTFSRGFFNTPPASGHFNAGGQLMIADEIIGDLKLRGL